MAAPWIWGRNVDLAVFGGSAAAALLLAALSPALSEEGALPMWGWVVFVLAIDVAHVHTTLFRTYLDRDELRRRKVLYTAVPLLCWVAGVALHLASSLTFWRVLAYVAVFHFVRQQAGWVAIYRARAGERARLDRVLDDALIYAATGFPLLHWHAHLPRSFRWFVEGDFVTVSWLRALLPVAGVLYGGLALAYVVRNVWRMRAGAPLNAGKHLVVAATAITWYVGIVALDSDFAFTVTNVIAHGVPYMALLWGYTRERGRERPGSVVARVAAGGFAAFLATALAFAFFEELLWDRLVWHDRPSLFGGPGREAPWLGPLALSLIVPLLAVPQATHYVLDAVLWRRRDTRKAQARALGFGAS
ncbi:hypothetical protein [Chondromyces crocatus]|uniref:Uncharacterized protein n=1 Tax=Chondromyces crocatus TaxID=52 RepID=A0A0K1E866_CHOCO|nr:hypothetical protein [Chondromyces crocatus]AKT36882.1 uncharacterized protein CMC5_010030 [Chondromyces crocatus]